MPFPAVHRVYLTCDVTPIAWQADFISGCRGFALQREVSGAALFPIGSRSIGTNRKKSRISR
jgi:hypothetical protein